MAAVKVKVSGGSSAFINVYAPHSGHEYGSRCAFYNDLDAFARSFSVHGPVFFCGDFNARFRKQLPCEEQIVGPFVFKSSLPLKESSNRFLMLELCESHDLFLANTFHPHPDDERVTYYEIGSKPGDHIVENRFAQIDFMLVPRSFANVVTHSYSTRNFSLASHHFPVITELSLKVAKAETIGSSPKRLDYKSLRNEETAAEFVREVRSNFPHELCRDLHSNVSAACGEMVSCLSEAATRTLPTALHHAQYPWISAHTVSLIDERHAARVSRNHELEQSLHKQVKKSARHDRTQWLDELASSGDWNSLKQLRKRKQPSQGRLRDSSGDYVSLEMRADTFAKHLEQVQWAVRPCSADAPSEAIGPDLAVECAPMTSSELEAAIKKLAQGRAAGIDGIPAELWRAILADQETFASVLGFYKHATLAAHPSSIEACIADAAVWHRTVAKYCDPNSGA